MENRSVIKVLLLSIVTFGIYSILWGFWTTKELNDKGASIPTAWLQLLPIVNLYWYYKYYEGAEQVTGGKVSHVLYFVLALFVSPIVSMLLAQNEYNKMGGAMPGQAPMGGQPQAAPQAAMPQDAQPMPAQPAPQQMPQQPAAPVAPAQPVPTAPEAPANNDVLPPQPPQQPPLVQ